jgi:hypothetical protein
LNEIETWWFVLKNWMRQRWDEFDSLAIHEIWNGTEVVRNAIAKITIAVNFDSIKAT